MSQTSIETTKSQEIEFYSEDSLVRISPSMNIKRLEMISGDYGPFKSGISTEVPLWLAIVLRKRNRCKLVPPDWLTVEYLEDRLKTERMDEAFCCLKPYAIEIGSRLIREAPGDFENPTQIRILLENIRELRLAKMKRDLHELGDPSAIKLNNISRMEINMWRAFLSGAMDHFYNVMSANPEDDFHMNINE